MLWITQKKHTKLKTNSLCAFRETTKHRGNWNIKDVPACAVQQSSSAQDICLVCFFAVTIKRHNAKKRCFVAPIGDLTQNAKKKWQKWAKKVLKIPFFFLNFQDIILNFQIIIFVDCFAFLPFL